MPSTCVVALVGNPNTGKTTLFNALTGFRQRVANYPGVTVEKKIGPLRGATDGRRIEILDLPGTYSLSPRSRDEMVVTDVLSGRQEGVDRLSMVVLVADASNLRRNLFLATQIMELGLPMVIALNMIDVAEAAGVRIDMPFLQERLGCRIVPVQATQGRGVAELVEIIRNIERNPSVNHSFPPMPEPVEIEISSAMKAYLNNGKSASRTTPARCEIIQALLESSGHSDRQLEQRFGTAFIETVRHSRLRLVESGIRPADIEAEVRYPWIDEALEGVVTRVREESTTWSDRVDRILTHRVFGLIFFIGLMALVFQAIYTWAGPLMDLIDGAFSGLAAIVSEHIPPGALRSLLTDGIIAGVGGVLVFLPQILILFLFLAILEDCGYMARGALLVNRFMRVLGLNGKAFIPLLSSFACAVPGIMATRTIERTRDRFITILIAPLMSCSARLPVYTLLIAAFIPAKTILGGWVGLQGGVLLCMYLVGIAVAIPVALVLRYTIFRGPQQEFILELPGYKRPQWKTVFFRVYERGREFVVRAGTIIFAVSILIWAMAYYPRPASIAATYEAQRAELAEANAAAPTGASTASESMEERLDAIDRQEAGTYLRQSILGRMGQAVEPVVKPLGWDWRIGMATIASFPAREVIIATLGTIFNVGSDVDDESQTLKGALKSATWPDGQRLFTIPVALSIMVFFALCCQCAATLAVMKRETNSWRWPVFAFVYMTTLAYVGAWATYRVALMVV